MVRVVIATMVKDEDDVIEEWIRYYSSLFGYKNLFIIDNNSSDKTYEICEKYLKYGLHLERHDNYKMKGALMTMIKNNNPSDFFIPVDIDEFIVYKNKGATCVFYAFRIFDVYCHFFRLFYNLF